MNTILTKIRENDEQFSSSQKKIADFILANYKQAAFLNSLELSETIGVSNPTIIRFATLLGFPGFPQFQEALQKLIQHRLSSLERLDYLKENANNHLEGSVFQTEMQNLMTAYERLEPDKIAEAARLLSSAEQIYVVGRQISATLAQFAAYSLGKIRPNVRNLSDWTMDDYHALKRASRSACALVIALPRYPQKTLHILKTLHEQKIPIVLITDSDMFPYLGYAQTTIFTSFKYISFIDPIATPICLLNSIIIGVAHHNQEETSHNLNTFEQYVNDEEVYYRNGGEQ